MEYNYLNGEMIFPSSYLPKMLKQARCKVDVSLETIMLKDSREITDLDREEIFKSCINAEEEKIIITHGTDTMVETAQVLEKNIKDKTVVLLGAMIPYSFGNSDALFNLGCAVSAVQSLPKGVYITMNGKIFSCDKVRKNKEIGEFETV